MGDAAGHLSERGHLGRLDQLKLQVLLFRQIAPHAYQGYHPTILFLHSRKAPGDEALLTTFRMYPRLHLLDLPLPDEVAEERLEVRPVWFSEEIGELAPCHFPRRDTENPLSGSVPGHHCAGRIQGDNQVIGALHYAGQMSLDLSHPLAPSR